MTVADILNAYLELILIMHEGYLNVGQSVRHFVFDVLDSFRVLIILVNL